MLESSLGGPAPLRDIAESIGIAGALATEGSAVPSQRWAPPPVGSERTSPGARAEVRGVGAAAGARGRNSRRLAPSPGASAQRPGQGVLDGISRSEIQRLLSESRFRPGASGAYGGLRDGYGGYPLLQINVSGGAGVENGVVGGGTVEGGGGGTGGGARPRNLQSASPGSRSPQTRRGSPSHARWSSGGEPADVAPYSSGQRKGFNIFEVEHQFDMPAVAPPRDGGGDAYAVAAAPPASPPKGTAGKSAGPQGGGAAAASGRGPPGRAGQRAPSRARSLWDRYRWVWALLIAVGAAGVVALVSWAIASSVRADNERTRARRAAAEFARRLATYRSEAPQTAGGSAAGDEDDRGGTVEHHGA